MPRQGKGLRGPVDGRDVAGHGGALVRRVEVREAQERRVPVRDMDDSIVDRAADRRGQEPTADEGSDADAALEETVPEGCTMDRSNACSVHPLCVNRGPYFPPLFGQLLAAFSARSTGPPLLHSSRLVSRLESDSTWNRR